MEPHSSRLQSVSMNRRQVACRVVARYPCSPNFTQQEPPERSTVGQALRRVNTPDRSRISLPGRHANAGDIKEFLIKNRAFASRRSAMAPTSGRDVRHQGRRDASAATWLSWGTALCRHTRVAPPRAEIAMRVTPAWLRSYSAITDMVWRWIPPRVSRWITPPGSEGRRRTRGPGEASRHSCCSQAGSRSRPARGNRITGASPARGSPLCHPRGRDVTQLDRDAVPQAPTTPPGAPIDSTVTLARAGRPERVDLPSSPGG
jgi:hypothetical protein